MNKETNSIIKALENSSKWKDKIRALKVKHNNFKDFHVMCNYVVVELVNTEKKLFNLDRKKIDLEFISNMYFWD